MGISRQIKPLSLAGLVLPVLLFASCTPSRTSARRYYYNPLEAEIERVNTAAFPEDSLTVRPGETPRQVARRAGVDFEVFAEANGISGTSELRGGEVLLVPRVADRSRWGPGRGGAALLEGGAGKLEAAPPERPQGGAGAAAGEVGSQTSGGGEETGRAGGTGRGEGAGRAGGTAVPDSSQTERATSGEERGRRGVPETGDPVDSEGNVRSLGAGKVAAVHRGYTGLGDVVIIESAAGRAVYSGDFDPAVCEGEEVAEGAVLAMGARRGGVRVRFFEK